MLVLAGQLWKEETKGKRRRTLRVKGFEAVMMVVAAKAFEARTQRVIREATHASMPRERERERERESFREVWLWVLGFEGVPWRVVGGGGVCPWE
jgi:hypothetical protein